MLRCLAIARVRIKSSRHDCRTDIITENLISVMTFRAFFAGLVRPRPGAASLPMRVLISGIDGNTKRGSVEPTELVAALATRLNVPIDCCLTLAAVPLEGERTLAE